MGVLRSHVQGLGVSDDPTEPEEAEELPADEFTAVTVDSQVSESLTCVS